MAGELGVRGYEWKVTSRHREHGRNQRRASGNAPETSCSFFAFLFCASPSSALAFCFLLALRWRVWAECPPLGAAGGEGGGERRELICLMTFPGGYRETSLPRKRLAASCPPGAKLKYKINGASVFKIRVCERDLLGKTAWKGTSVIKMPNCKHKSFRVWLLKSPWDCNSHSCPPPCNEKPSCYAGFLP